VSRSTDPKKPKAKSWGGARPGAGRKVRDPAAGKLVKTSTQLSQAILDWMDAEVAAGRATSRAALIQRAVEELRDRSTS
jgi:hypothetical protein